MKRHSRFTGVIVFFWRRLISSLLSLVIVLLMMTISESVIGLDVARTLAGPKASAAFVAALDHELGLDRSFWQRFTQRAAAMLHGDLGNSFIYGSPTAVLLAEALSRSASALFLALLIGVVLGVPAGIWAAHSKTSLRSTLLAMGSAFALLPSLIPSTLFVYTFGFRLAWSPSSRVVSVAIISCTPLAIVALTTLAEYERILSSEHVRFARSLGYTDWHVLLIYGFKEAIPGIVTNLSSVVLYLVTATVFVEIVFAEPGLGVLLLNATEQLDYPIILAFTLLMVVAISLMNLLTGLVLYAVDPRVWP